ncbi:MULTISPECIES: GGDEF domain-containing protein [unclassified Pseudoalteromonas]|uniref:GGDEF domain-containing protein n=1 Tax=unclassified Pseudoalteromonas TaxID=194690 RepID=UPI002097AE20|nr:GGDEF domain-containing protein [Pseudoalteromonas sp. XMcav2-N]MCO7187479.1 GGDEF domain-containing protein [Pseudoalteromonas sp. XMcav2-N]
MKNVSSLCLALVISIVLTMLALFIGELKSMQDVDWVDLIGEATSSMMAAIWLILLALCRPRGRVTTMLLLGSATYWLTTWLDVLDEFIAYPPQSHLFTWLESLPAPISMTLLTWGLVTWYREQQAVNRQLKQREHFHREHSLIDPVTQLYSLQYLLIQLNREAILHDKRNQPLSLVMVDINGFAQYNREHGAHKGDQALNEVASALEVALRETDLACRYTSDRFVVLLPDTPPHEVDVFSKLIQNCSNAALKGALTVTTVQATRTEGESEQALFERLNQRLAGAKRASSAAVEVV